MRHLHLSADFSRSTTVSPILTSLRDHPFPSEAYVRGYLVTLTGLCY
jgi:hypothetical protein